MWALSKIKIPYSLSVGCSISSIESGAYLHQEQISKNVDVAIIGGGIVGTCVARELLNRNPNLNAILVEKENSLAKHQSSHNSGVIHTGIYYKSNSLKSKLCTEGVKPLFEYCDKKNIPYIKCGKLIIATDYDEIDNLKEFYKRGINNGVTGLRYLNNKKDIREVEPKCEGVRAIYSPNTANVDFGVLTKTFADDFRDNGGKFCFNFKVDQIKQSNDFDFPILIKSKDEVNLKAKYVICCSGLQSETLSENTGRKNDDGKIISFQVNYQKIKPYKHADIRTNIYKVPDPNLPFLGIHVSPCPDGSILLGPSAIPAFKIEGYMPTEININYIRSLINYRGFQRMVMKNFSTCLSQMEKFFCTTAQAKDLQKIAPSITERDLQKQFTAVQAQLITKDGDFYDDFVIEVGEGEGIRRRIINCRFLPSPAASSCMAIAKMINDNFYNYLTLN